MFTRISQNGNIGWMFRIPKVFGLKQALRADGRRVCVVWLPHFKKTFTCSYQWFSC